MTEGAAELKDHKMAVNDSDKVVVLLQGVPASYNLIVSQLMNKTGTTFKQACRELRVHKMTLLKKSHNQRPNDDEKSRRRKKKGNRGDRKQDHTMLAGNAARTNPCFNCGKTDGHRASDCKSRKSSCRKCGKDGHQARFCEDVHRIAAIMKSRREEQKEQPETEAKHTSLTPNPLATAPTPSTSAADTAAPRRKEEEET